MKMGVIFFKKCIQGVFEDALAESGIDFVCKRQLLFYLLDLKKENADLRSSFTL